MEKHCNFASIQKVEYRLLEKVQAKSVGHDGHYYGPLTFLAVNYRLSVFNCERLSVTHKVKYSHLPRSKSERHRSRSIVN